MTVSSEKQPLIILGSGAWAVNQLDYFLLEKPDEYEFIGFCQNKRVRANDDKLEGYPVLSLDDLPALAGKAMAFNALGNPASRDRFVRQVEELGFDFVTFISRHALLHPRMVIGPGCAILRSTVSASLVHLGAHCTITSSSVLGEAARLGRCCHVAPSAVVGGSTILGDRCFVGMGAVIIEGLTIGDDVTIGAGAVVIRDIPDGATVVGNPARIVKRTLSEERSTGTE